MYRTACQDIPSPGAAVQMVETLVKFEHGLWHCLVCGRKNKTKHSIREHAGTFQYL